MIRGRRLARYSEDGRCDHDYVVTGCVTLRRRRPVVGATLCNDLRERIWQGLRASGFTGDEIARICEAAARHPDHINRALRRLDSEARRAPAG